MNEGRLVSNRGLNIDVAEYEDHFVEQHVKHSNALQSVVRGRGSYLVGPLARFNLNFDQLPAVGTRGRAAGGAEATRQESVSRHRGAGGGVGIRLRGGAAHHSRVRASGRAAGLVAPRGGVGQAITEAPRGILYHRYTLDDEGLILAAKIVPPTSQNQKRIEDDLREFAAQVAAWPIEEATWKCEQAIRNYDPCISCATHFLRLVLERE